MVSSKLPRVLILTAGYGEGHHSAARGVAEALAGKAECRVMDVCQETMPRMFTLTRDAYLWVISQAPGLWRALYDWSDRIDLSQTGAGVLIGVEHHLDATLQEWRPDVVVSTYMLYPYMLDRLATNGKKCAMSANPLRVPYVTVVTDSIVINKSWVCSQSDLWCVTDAQTKAVMEQRGVLSDRIEVTGFPVSLSLSSLPAGRGDTWVSGQEFRVLYFAQGSPKKAAADLLALLSAGGDVHVTCILGHRFRKVYPHIRALRQVYGHRLVVRGWTTRVPNYLADHHVVVGKAGGATVHEVLAAKRPMLIHYLLPGQEEGNLELLEYLKVGEYVPNSQGLRDALLRLMAREGQVWRQMRKALEDANMTGGARAVAEFALKLISPACK
ncbi:MAG: hypothetical protein RR138_04145 [Akkermansia sp.]